MTTPGELPEAPMAFVDTNDSSQGVHAISSHLNPRYLLKLRKESKALKITDFIYSLKDGEHEEVISKDPKNESTVILRTNATKKVSLDNVMPSQWASANNRILAELIERKELTSLNEVMAYLEY